MNLRKTGELIDTMKNMEIKPIEVLQWSSLKDKYIVGVYSKTASGNQAHVDFIRIIDKKTNSLIQEIDASKMNPECGNGTYVIYGNTLIEKPDDKGIENITLWNNYQGMGGYYFFIYDKQTYKYKLKCLLPSWNRLDFKKMRV